MNRTSPVLALTVAALAGCAPSPIKIAEAATRAEAELLYAAVTAQFPATHNGPANNFPSAVRLPVADSRLGPWLLGGGILEAKRYAWRLKERNVNTIGLRVSYPILSGKEARHDQYALYYRELAAFLRDRNMKVVVHSGPQFRDSNFFRGQGIDDQCNGNPTGQFADYLTKVAEIISPDYLLIDMKPSVLARAAGCKDLADAENAAALTLDVVRQLVRDTAVPVGVSTDLDDDDEYFELVARSDLDFFLGLSITSANTTIGGLRQRLDQAAERAAGTAHSLAIDSAWFRKDCLRGMASETEPLRCDGTPDVTANAAIEWQAADLQLVRSLEKYASQNGWLFSLADETDLLAGAYLNQDEIAQFDTSPVKIRRAIQLKARQLRRVRTAELR